MQIAITIFVFILGAIFGSFGGVLISRQWDKKGIKSIFFGRSKCEKCQKNLSAIELIPLLSFFIQKGKCKTCRSKISNFYRIIELLSGFVFVSTYLLFPYNGFTELLFRIIINWSFLLLIIFDIQKHELHIPIRIFVMFVSLIFSILFNDFEIMIYSVLVFLVTFLIIYFFSRYYVKLRFNKVAEGFGQGDVLFAIVIGALFPFVYSFNQIDFNLINLIDIVLIYVIISSILGLVYSILNILFFDGNKKILPFLPSMILAYIILLFFADFLLNIIR